MVLKKSIQINTNLNNNTECVVCMKQSVMWHHASKQTMYLLPHLSGCTSLQTLRTFLLLYSIPTYSIVSLCGVTAQVLNELPNYNAEKQE
jgi:hypothetical protein